MDSLVLFRNCAGIHLSFTITCDDSCGFVRLRKLPYVTSRVSVCVTHRCWSLSNAASASVGTIMWFLFVPLLIRCIMLINFWMWNRAWIIGINPTRSWWIILFTSDWIWFTSILLRIFACISQEVSAHGFPAMFLSCFAVEVRASGWPVKCSLVFEDL